TLNPPQADIVGQELRFRYERADTEIAPTKAAFDSELGNVRQWLGWVANDVTMFNDSLLPKVKAKIADRRNRLEKAKAGVHALGLPVRQESRVGASATLVHTPAPSP